MARRRNAGVLLGLLVVVAVVMAAGLSSAGAGHDGPVKGLFGGRWNHAVVGEDYASWMTLSTSAFFFDCGTDEADCASRWQAPAQDSVDDWNSQPTTVTFDVLETQDSEDDVHVRVVNVIEGNPAILGMARFYNQSGQLCNPSICNWRYADALAADVPHTGALGTAQDRQATLAHELGHLLSLAHESVGHDCGQDSTGPVPPSIMAYNCIDPPIEPYNGQGIYQVQPWDACGVNHAYYDPSIGYESCDDLMGTPGPTPSVTPTPTPTATPAPSVTRFWGDVDCDGTVAIGDALKVARYLIGLPASQEPGCPAMGASVFVAVPVEETAGVANHPAPSGPAVPGELIVRFRPGVPQAERVSAVATRGATVKRHLRAGDLATVTVPVGREQEFAASFGAHPLIEYAEPNLLRELATHEDKGEPDDPFFEHQWHMHQIQVEEAWHTSTGEGVTIAVLDSGIAYTNATKNSVEFAQAPDLAEATFVFPFDAFDGGFLPLDDNGHGTHVAGTLAQSTNNSIGGVGVAYEAAIMPVKVCGQTPQGYRCPSDHIVDGIEWAVTNGANVINMSLAGEFPSGAEREAIEAAHAAGVVVVAAAGNGDNSGNGLNKLSYPAAYPEVISVGATRFDMERTKYSNYGAGEDGVNLDLMAPGGQFSSGAEVVDGVLQETYADACPVRPNPNFTAFTFCFYNGTSMASPHVAGVAALLLSAYTWLTPEEVRGILHCSALELGDPFGYGAGLVQAHEALKDSNKSGTPDCLERTWADVDCDGSVAIGDALKIARHLIGLSISQQPGCPPMTSQVVVEDSTGPTPAPTPTVTPTPTPTP